MSYLSCKYRQLFVLLLVSVSIGNFGPLVSAQLKQRIDPGIVIRDKIVLKGSVAIIDSYSSDVTTYSPYILNDAAVVTVNSRYSRTVNLLNKASIRGDVYVGPGSILKRSIHLSHRCTITGRKVILNEDIPLPGITEPNLPPFNQPIEGDLTMRKGQNWILDTDMHVRKLIITHKSVLTVEGNVILVVDEDFVLGPDAQLQITRGSTLDLYVAGDCLISGQLNSLRAQPWALHLYMPGRNNLFQTRDGAAVFSILQNPEGSVRFDTDTRFFGKIKARTLESYGPIHIDTNSSFPPIEFVRRKPRTRSNRW